MNRVDRHLPQHNAAAGTTLGHALVMAVRSAQTHHALFPAPAAGVPTIVVVGVSGGLDSVCLLHALHTLAAPWRLALHIAHVDHALRPTSAEDAHFVAQMAVAYDLPLHTTRLAPDSLRSHPAGLEAAARQARHAFLRQTAINVTPARQVPLIALAHHADDQAETLLLNLLRGSGLDGLAGMRSSTAFTEQDRVVRVVRPLLAVRRATILAYAQAHQLAWREDASNAEEHLLRNRLRHTILPLLTELNPNLVATLGQTAAILAAEADRAAHCDQATLARLMTEPPPTSAHPPMRIPRQECYVASEDAAPLKIGVAGLPRVVLDLDQLVTLDRASQRGVLRQALTLLRPHLYGITFEQVETILTRVQTSRAASGPHPLQGELAWSVLGARAERPAQLSLHCRGELPVTPTHPWLDAAWRATVGQLTVPHAGVVTPIAGWQLHVTRLARADLPDDWRLAEQPWQAFLDADQVAAPVLTTPQPGWRIAPLRLDGHTKTLGDLFTDHKIPLVLRSGWPVVIDGTSGQVLWLCGVAVAHSVRITTATAQVLWLQWQQDASECKTVDPLGHLSGL